MEPLHLTVLLERLRGRWIGETPPSQLRVAQLETDTRALKAGSLFVALQGGRFDGHKFVGEARRRGAIASVVCEDAVASLPADGGPYVAVDDPLTALERLASWNRRRLELSVVGVTGSVGKTSTKEFLATILSSRFAVCRAPKSFNNRLGVALTLLSAGRGTDILVVELATSGPGELAHLSCLVRPERVVLTEIAPAHLQGLGDLDGVVLAKAEVLAGLARRGTLFLRRGVYGFETFVGRHHGRPTTFGWDDASGLDGASDSLDYRVSDCKRVRLDDASQPHPGGVGRKRSDPASYGYQFTLGGAETFVLPVPGRHNVLNATAAIAVARDYGLSWEEIRGALLECRLPPQRGQVLEEGGVVLFDDSYNANPGSMVAAIQEWQSYPEADVEVGAGGLDGTGPDRTGADSAERSSTRIAVLGDMLELGGDSRAHHERIGRELAGCSARVLVTVGEESAWIEHGYREVGGRAKTLHVATAEDAARRLPSLLRAGDRVLFKGSRGIGLERALQAVRRSLQGRS